jgi:hypothetical protein
MPVKTAGVSLEGLSIVYFQPLDSYCFALQLRQNYTPQIGNFRGWRKQGLANGRQCGRQNSLALRRHYLCFNLHCAVRLTSIHECYWQQFGTKRASGASAGNIYRRSDNSRPVSFIVRAWRWVYAYRQKRERERQARGISTKCANNSDPITSTFQLLLMQNSVTAHAHQS